MDQALRLACARREKTPRLDRAPQTYAPGRHAQCVSARAKQNISRLVPVAALYFAARLSLQESTPPELAARTRGRNSATGSEETKIMERRAHHTSPKGFTLTISSRPSRRTLWLS